VSDRSGGLVGELAAGRPVVVAAVIAFGAAALAAVGYRDATLAYSSASISFLAALAVMVVLPAASVSVAPNNFWLRLLYAGFAAGLLLAVRRLAAQGEIAIRPFDHGLALTIAAGASVILAAAAPMWRFAVGGSLIGLASVILGAAGGLSLVAIETSSGAVEAAGSALSLAAALGAALAVHLAARFARAFAEGGDNHSAAAVAAREAAAPAFFSFASGVAGIAATVFSAGAAPQETLVAARVAAAALAFCLAAPLFLLAGANAIRAKSEAIALAENRRRAALRPFLVAVSRLLPPSAALSASAIFFIIATVAGFETKTPAGAGEIGAAIAIAIFAGISFVSLRTALLTTIILLAGGRIVLWGGELVGLAPPTESARIVASLVAAALFAQLFLAWRDRRHLRRKSREVVSMALADGYFSYVGAAVLAVAALAAGEAAGLWREGGEAALFTGALALIGAVAAPALMTATGALFGRN
jgi:hypothetical protein